MHHANSLPDVIFTNLQRNLAQQPDLLHDWSDCCIYGHSLCMCSQIYSLFFWLVPYLPFQRLAIDKRQRADDDGQAYHCENGPN